MTSTGQKAEQPEIAEAIRLLCEARQSGRIVRVPEALGQLTEEQAYGAQAAYIRTFGKRISGWKIGATNPVSQNRLGLNGPFFGPVFEDDIFASEDPIPIFQQQDTFVETEICLRLNRDLQLPDGPPAALSLDALDISVALAFEIVCARFAGGLQNAGRLAIADGGINHAVLVGEFTDLHAFDSSRFDVQLEKNGSRTSSGNFDSVIWQQLADPLSWLLGRRELHGESLKAGCIIMTGTMTGMVPISGGDQIAAHSAELGSVRASFTDSWI